MNTIYKPIPSPYKTRTNTVRKVIDARNDNHPIRNELRKLCGNPYNLHVSFVEDEESLKQFSHISGFVAILCRIELNGVLIAEGRGSVVISRMNRNLERSLYTALNGSFLSAANHATRVFDSLRLNDAGQQKATQEFGEKYESVLEEVAEPATLKQKSYLAQLAQTKLDASEREEFLANLETMTKDEASEAIQNFVGE